MLPLVLAACHASDAESHEYLDTDFCWAQLSIPAPTRTIPTSQAPTLRDLFLLPSPLTTQTHLRLAAHPHHVSHAHRSRFLVVYLYVHMRVSPK